MTLSGLLLLSSYTRGSTAVSNAGATISEAARKVTADAERSQAIYGRNNAIVSDLIALKRDSMLEGAQVPISEMTLAVAIEFATAMPASWPSPELAIDPDGGISLDWFSSRHRQLSVSIGERRRMAFAWLDGSNSGHGVVQFDGYRIPRELSDLISYFGNHEISALRPA